ncbi:MAG TPA: glycosyltransferase family 1 protein [Candidatus Dormibacteraeota bacterium]
MRIAVFTETAPPNLNGVVRRLDQTLQRLLAGGDEVLVFAPGPVPSEWSGAEVVPAPYLPLPLYPEIAAGFPRPALRSRLARFRPDVVHVVNPALLGAGGIVYARSLGVPVMASFHTHLPKYLSHYGLGALEPLAWGILRSVHNKAALNLCISDPIAEELRGHGIERVHVAWRGGVDADLFNPKRRSREMRARLTDGNPDAPLLVSAGRLSAEKGLDLLGGVLPRLPGARLALVGDGPHRADLEQQFAGLPVHFAGYLRGEELASAVAAADAFVFTSQTDTLGLVVLEAMAAGVPVVACNSGGVPDLVRPGWNGLLFEPGDAIHAAAALGRVLGDAGLSERLSLAGRRFAERWTWDAGVADLRGCYERLVAAQTPARAA